MNLEYLTTIQLIISHLFLCIFNLIFYVLRSAKMTQVCSDSLHMVFEKRLVMSSLHHLFRNLPLC